METLGRKEKHLSGRNDGIENPRSWCCMAERSSPMGVAGQKGKAMGSRGDEAGVRNEPSLRGRAARGCAGEAGLNRPCSRRRVRPSAVNGGRSYGQLLSG